MEVEIEDSRRRSRMMSVVGEELFVVSGQLVSAI